MSGPSTFDGNFHSLPISAGPLSNVSNRRISSWSKTATPPPPTRWVSTKTQTTKTHTTKTTKTQTKTNNNNNIFDDSVTAALRRTNLIDDYPSDTGAVTPSAPSFIASPVIPVGIPIEPPPTGIPVGDDALAPISASTCFGFPKALFKDGTTRPWEWGGAFEDRQADRPEILLVDNAAAFRPGPRSLEWSPYYDEKHLTNLWRKYGLQIGLLKNGTVKAWGSCSVDIPEELQIVGNVVQLSLGGAHAIALLKDGSVRVLGNRNDENVCNFAVPEDLRTATQRVLQVAAGAHSVALLEDGTLRAWGHNDDGQCDVPAELCFALEGQRVVQIAAGLKHTVVLLANGTVKAWGCNKVGQCNVSSKGFGTRRVVQVAAQVDRRVSRTVVLFADGTTKMFADDIMPPTSEQFQPQQIVQHVPSCYQQPVQFQANRAPFWKAKMFYCSLM